MKRGQVTVYVVLGILVLAVVAGIFVTKSIISKSGNIKETVSGVTLPLHVQQIKSYVESCTEEMASTGMYVLGLQGGHLVPPTSALETEEFKIAYGYYEGKKTLASLSDMEKEFAEYMELIIPNCVDVSRFPAMEITGDDASARAKFEDDMVIVELIYPLTIIKDGVSFELKDKIVKNVMIKFGAIYAIAEEVVAREIEDPENIHLDYLLSTDLDVEIVPYSDDDIVYFLTDTSPEPDFIFAFANRF